jgi:hypothetical protein
LDKVLGIERHGAFLALSRTWTVID